VKNGAHQTTGDPKTQEKKKREREGKKEE